MLAALAGMEPAWTSGASLPSLPETRAAAPRSPSAAQKPSVRRRPKETRTGVATFIARKFDGRRTASGALYDGSAFVAAHPTYPMGTVLRVTNQTNGRTVEVRVIDRSARGARRPMIDLSRAAAERLDFIRQGTAKVTLEVLEWGSAP